MQLLQRALGVCAILCLFSTTAFAADRQNILVIWGDDIGWENVSACGMVVMGYTTPNIDSIGTEGLRFTDPYAQPSCTAGRAAFITGQYGHLMQKVSWLIQPMGELMAAHLQSLAEYPPVQGARALTCQT